MNPTYEVTGQVALAPGAARAWAVTARASGSIRSGSTGEGL